MFESLHFHRIISIHAPTRGATHSHPEVMPPVPISIHAPTRGATISFAVRFSRPEFQSTLLQEERQSMTDLTVLRP